MFTYALRRVLLAVALLLSASVLTFLLMHFSGGDPAASLAGPEAGLEQMDAKRRELGLDRPLPEQYFSWLAGMLHGDFGASWVNGQNVGAAIANKLPLTLSLAVGTLLVSALVGVGVGYFAALRRGWLDGALQLAAIVGFALPGFWIALVLSSIFAVQLGWFPATGFVDPTTSLTGWLNSIILPIAALAIGDSAAIAGQTRNAVIGVLSRDYVRTLRSRGLPFREIAFRNVLRNAMPSSLSIISLQFIGLLGGALMVENVFALPGLGSFAVEATSSGDIPAVMATVMIAVGVVATVNLLIDFALGWLNPKVRNA